MNTTDRIKKMFPPKPEPKSPAEDPDLLFPDDDEPIMPDTDSPQYPD